MTVETAGSYSSEDNRTSYEWAMPEYSTADHAACRVGLHIVSRKVVVTGWVGYFSQVRRAYCACGRKCWIWFEDGWVSRETTAPGAHLEWIAGRVER